MKSRSTAAVHLLAAASVLCSATCSLVDLDGLSTDKTTGAQGGAAGAAEGGAGTSASGAGADGSGASPAGSGASASSGSAGAGGVAQSASSSGAGCVQVCTPDAATYVDCAPCYKRLDTCSSDGCSVMQGECTAFQCQPDQICGGGAQCCFGDSHSCQSIDQCCGGVCAGGFCYSCQPYGEPCGSDMDCCPGAPYCDFGTCASN